MANVIDTSYFIGDIEIANLNQPQIVADVNNSIVVYEKEVLIALLGYSVWKDLQTWLAAPASGDKFDKLVNGEEFSFTLNSQTITTKWEGLRGYNKKSLVAYYVYFMQRRKRASYNAGVGMEVEPKTENSTPTSLYEKLVFVWNEFVNMYGGDCFDDDTLLENYTHSDDLPSAYNYLLAKKADFPTWEFSTMGGELNRFGI